MIAFSILKMSDLSIRASEQEKLNVTTGTNSNDTESEKLDLNFYLGVYAGNVNFKIFFLSLITSVML